ncbi:MAG: hypothetical protein ACFFC6_11275 [Promethearchaeota archaeon]
MVEYAEKIEKTIYETVKDLDFVDAFAYLKGVKGMSQRQIVLRVKKMGENMFTQTFISELARGIDKPNKRHLELIAKGLDVKPEYFKEYREFMVQEKVKRIPGLADAYIIIDEDKINSAPKNEREEVIAEELERAAKIIRERIKTKKE